ncbi:MAG: serine protease [Nanoarchaeota archaeon]|nr:serine protease [Nanoarchaeota archaeon]
MKKYRKRIGLATLAFAGVLCTSDNNPGEDKGNYFTKEQLDALYDATFRVNTTITLEQKVDDDQDFLKLWFGSGTLIVDSQTGDNYILTAEHITSDGMYTSQKTGRTTKIVREVIMVGGHEASVFKEDEENDLALLKVDGYLKDINDQPVKPFRGKIAKYLDPQDYVIGAGFPRGNKELFNTRVKKIADDKTFLDIYMIGGNSGGGVYLINEKELQLCGVVTKTNNIPSLQKFRKFLTGTPLEDDYL